MNITATIFFCDGSEYEIDFDIMNIDSKYSYINVLFYSVGIIARTKS